MSSCLKGQNVRAAEFVLMITKFFQHKINLFRTSEDSLLWLKLDKTLFENDQDLYLCCVYIQPAGNSYYTHYDCDLFECLEQDLELANWP